MSKCLNMLRLSCIKLVSVFILHPWKMYSFDLYRKRES